MHKFKKQILSNKGPVLNQARIRPLHISQRSNLDRLILSTSNGIHVIPFEEIKRLEAQGNYCTVILNDGQKILASKTLKGLEAQLPNDGFIKVHQSHIVRKKAIRLIETSSVRLTENEKIPLSRSKRKELINVFTKSK